MTLPLHSPLHSPLRSPLHSAIEWKWGGGPEVQLSSTTSAEDAADNTVVGALTVSNLGMLTVSSYAITADPSNKFAISGTNLIIDELLDYETATSHTVTIQATLSDASTTSRTFTINVTDVDESSDAILDTLQVETDGLVIDGLLNRTLVRTATVDSASTPNALLTYTAPSAKYVTNSSGLLVSASTIRTDHTAAGVALGILVEEARTNVVLQSEDASTSWSNANGGLTITTNQAVAPDGATTMDKLTVLNNANEKSIFQNVGASVTNAQSAYAKAAGYNYLFFRSSDAVNGYTNVIFNLSNGTVASTGAGWSSATMTDAGGGIYRCSAVKTFNAAPVVVGCSVDGASITAAGNGTDGIYVWGMQLEAGAFPTSYIKTTGTVTRAADQISLATSAFPWSATAGYMLFYGNTKSASATVSWSVSDGTNNERFQSNFQADSHLVAVDGGVPQAIIDAGTVSSNTDTKIAGSWAVNDFAASINGGAAVTYGAATLPTVTSLYLGLLPTDVTSNFDGHVKYLKYVPRRVTNANLATEST
jgi:hypothetical protein